MVREGRGGDDSGDGEDEVDLTGIATKEEKQAGASGAPRLKPHLQHWKADSLPLSQLGSPVTQFSGPEFFTKFSMGTVQGRDVREL